MSRATSESVVMNAPARRVRLKPWLVAQVDSGRFPGLRWMDSERRLFQMPWKHATHGAPARQEESSIFKAWALETGKFQEGVDDPDPAKWKANLRCALNKSKEFQLQFDGTKETPFQAYKIYRVVNTDAAAAADDDEMPDLTELTLGKRSRPSPRKATFRRLGGLSESGFRDAASSASVPPALRDANRFRATAVTSEPPRQDFPVFDGVGFEHPEAGAAVRAQVDPANLLGSIPSTDLEVKFEYRGRAMGSLTVSNPRGCRLFYGQLGPDPQQVELFGPVDLQQVSFPGACQIPSQKQRDFTQALLSVMDRGLVLEIWEQDIYAVRLCQCKVFWSGPGAPDRGLPNRLERERRVQVFSLSHFLQGLILYQKGEAQNPPPYEIYFCFGEDWPDQKPKEKKLIVVQVVPVVARILTEMFSGEHSWSIDSIRLQISNPDVKDQTVEQFKELQRLLQSQSIQGL
ncbi:interferon regulatory factor 5 isoform X2 [Hippocampus comes]|uniref:interferon regulatory factor 5 isoform X2 n=1 Tax=Hippocampus comes TaxID=109280 RepID=UPI00094EF4AB|nr:PREDICTED: interferon regulatory factor 5 isoform X2 [Hippocampus comes]